MFTLYLNTTLPVTHLVGWFCIGMEQASSYLHFQGEAVKAKSTVGSGTPTVLARAAMEPVAFHGSLQPSTYSWGIHGLPASWYWP